MNAGSACPCGTDRPYAACCKPLHDGEAATSAERLMRSRYSAYVLQLVAYLTATWHPSTRPAHLVLDHSRWLGLQIKQQATQGDRATVEFVARYKTGGKATRLHERSRFVREDGRWYYVDGEFPSRG